MKWGGGVGKAWELGKAKFATVSAQFATFKALRIYATCHYIAATFSFFLRIQGPYRKKTVKLLTRSLGGFS